MTKNAIKWLMIANITVGLNAVASAQDIDIGKSEFQSSCASCHGVDGKGKGPVSDQLKVAPTDLTIIAKKNNGVFPISALYETIDGRKAVAAHGTREMPVWGAFIPKFLYPYERLLNFTHDPEYYMRTRILAIVDYLNRIQEK